MKQVIVKFDFGKTLNWEELSEYSVYSSKRNNANCTKFWGSIVSNYKTAKAVDRDFFYSSNADGDALVNMDKVKTGDIIQLRFDERVSRKYTDRYEINAYVHAVFGDGLELILFDKLVQAVRYFNSLQKGSRAC